MRWPHRIAAGLVTAMLVVVVSLWLTLLSPFGYTPPEGLPPMPDGERHEVFVYGTLRSPTVRRVVIGRRGDAQPAVLDGFRRRHLNIEPAVGEYVEGAVLEISSDELRRLDRYERLGIRYERVRLTLRNGSEVWVYRRMSP
jgi:gamma-glutamylcyclotransferase (GGCT)/AIG2-like uncharacterized protein YtfP